MKFPTCAVMCGVLFFATNALAQDEFDMTGVSDRILSDPLYLTLQGQLFGASADIYSAEHQNNFDSTGAQTSHQRTSGDALSQAFEYGITDNLALRAAIGYELNQQTKTTFTSGAATRFVSRDGWEDPGFGVIWRALDQREFPLTLDLFGNYSPNAFPLNSATTTTEGTVARGGEAMNFGATVGREMRAFTIAGTFTATNVGRRNDFDSATGDIIQTAPSWNYAFALNTQTRLGHGFSFNAGAGYDIINHTNVDNLSTAVAHIQQTGDSKNLNASLNYELLPSTLVASVEYEHDFLGHVHDTFPTAPASDTSSSGRNSDEVGLRLRYVIGPEPF